MLSCLGCITLFAHLPRYGNNASAALTKRLHDVAEVVELHYGSKYARAVNYLRRLAENRYWQEATLQSLPWHAARSEAAAWRGAVPNWPDPILKVLAPSIPLRAVFSGDRQE